MALSQGLFKDQDQTEQDLTNGPGWTIDQQQPGFFDGFGVAPALRGIGQGASDGINLLAHGLQYSDRETPAEAVMSGPAGAARAQQGKTQLDPWQIDYNAKLAESENATRQFSKSLNPDPRTTGTAANLVQGFSHAVSEYAAGSLAGGPLAGASLLAASEGFAHYQDLRDQGVDEDTAKKSGVLTGLTAGGGALLPMGMPAKWLAGLSTTGTLLAQAGAGAVINTSFGAASRYASAKILEDAGYPEQAAQEKPWDETNLLTDAISGTFFGAHAGLHGLLKDLPIDPSIRDGAKVVQDRAEVNERAPGVPVDMKSAAIHRQALETALGDLMTGKQVDLSGVDTEGATFARPEIDETPATDIIREEFQKAGVMDFVDDFDRWLKGEEPKEPKEVSIARPEVTTEAMPPVRVYHGTQSDVASASALDKSVDLGPHYTTDPETARIFSEHEGKQGKILAADAHFQKSLDLPDMAGWAPRKMAGEIDKAHGVEGVDAGDGNGVTTPLQKQLDDLFTAHEKDKWERVPPDVKAILDRGLFAKKTLAEEGLVEKWREGETERYRAEQYDLLKQHLADKGYDSIKYTNKFEGKPADTFISLDQSKIRDVGVGPLADRPDLQIMDEHGEPLHAGDEQAKAAEAEAQANKEAEPMFQAAVGCEARHA